MGRLSEPEPDVAAPVGIARLETGLPALDAILGGGLPRRSVTVIAGPPGTGKTILAQQICFHGASPARRALYFSTLSEPMAKTLLYAGQFGFFDAKKLEDGVEFVDLGGIAWTGGLEEATGQIVAHVERVSPAVVVVDSFRVFDDFAGSRQDLRKFGYDLAVKLMVQGCTSLLLGEYAGEEVRSNPIFSIIDGVIVLRRPRVAGQRRRFIEVLKMRGTAHSLDAHPFEITGSGIAIEAPGAAGRRGIATANRPTRDRR